MKNLKGILSLIVIIAVLYVAGPFLLLVIAVLFVGSILVAVSLNLKNRRLKQRYSDEPDYHTSSTFRPSEDVIDVEYREEEIE